MNKAPSEILGESEAIIAAKNRLSRAARVNRPVLIVGERGTGKELAAARLHYLSPRWNGPYLTLNCAALNPNLLESELFGYESGAFTGAARPSPGRFEAADGGTLFLDEISHLSLPAQAKILRVVEYGSFQRLGSPRERRVDVRLVSATNVDLKARVRSGDFLPDLLDRLSFEIVTLPPLRERAGDILTLAHLFAARMAGELELAHIPTFSPEAAAALEAHPWPGNVRELKNTVERAVYREAARVIEAGDLELELENVGGRFRPDPVEPLEHHCGSGGAGPLRGADFPGEAPGPLPADSLGGARPLRNFDELLGAFADGLLEEALKRSRHNQKEAARMLGLSYHRFRFLRKKYRPEK